MTNLEAVAMLRDLKRETDQAIGILLTQAIRYEESYLPDGILLLGNYVIIARGGFHSLRSEKTSVLDPAEPTVAP